MQMVPAHIGSRERGKKKGEKNGESGHCTCTPGHGKSQVLDKWLKNGRQGMSPDEGSLSLVCMKS